MLIIVIIIKIELIN